MSPIPYSGPSPGCCAVLAKGCLEIFGLVLLIIPMAYIYVFSNHYDPFHRGFFCDDQNLKHPYIPQTVPIVQCVLIWAMISVFFIVLVETLRSWAETRTGSRRSQPIPDNRTPWIAVELYRHFGYFTLGAVTCLLFTELSKYSIGRLRPHYLTLCMPNLTKELCEDRWGYQKFVTESEDTMCQGLIAGTVTKKQLHEARLSFLSGHSSFSFYCAIFLIIYLQARLSNFPPIRNNTVVSIIYRSLKVLRPLIQFAMIILAFWISLTRISNYFHHPLDVATGALVGIIFALITMCIIADIFTKKTAFWKANKIETQESSNSNHQRNNTISIPQTLFSMGGTTTFKV